MNLFDLLTSVTIDLTFVEELAGQPLYEIMFYFITHGMWIAWAALFLWLAWHSRLNALQVKYHEEKKEFIVLAIDVPKDNFQTPKAVENIFTQIHQIAKRGNLKKQYLQGFTPDPMSFELVSIDGYTQYLVHLNSAHRDLLESAVYAQYPEAEIQEVADYVDDVPQTFPNDDYEMFGFELTLDPEKDSAYPLRTYTDFEDSMSKEFKDPLASVIESLSKLQKGEQVWMQFVVYPVMDREWKPKGEALVKKLAGMPVPKKPDSIFQKILDLPFKVFNEIAEPTLGISLPVYEAPEAKADLPSMLMHLSPGQKATIEHIEKKLSKFGFEMKVRIAYIGRKDIFSMTRGMVPLMGALKQFGDQDLNVLKVVPSSITDIDYFFAKSRIAARQNKMMKALKSRSLFIGGDAKIVNVEELATLYHFPLYTMKAPLMKTTGVRKGEAPGNLPRRR